MTLSRYTVAVVLTPDDQPLVCLSRRATRQPLNRSDMDAELRAAGYEPQPYATNVKRESWPLLAMVYRSPNREGKGRSGSTLYRVRCRRMEVPA